MLGRYLLVHLCLVLKYIILHVSLFMTPTLKKGSVGIIKVKIYYYVGTSLVKTVEIKKNDFAKQCLNFGIGAISMHICSHKQLTAVSHESEVIDN